MKRAALRENLFITQAHYEPRGTEIFDRVTGEIVAETNPLLITHMILNLLIGDIRSLKFEIIWIINHDETI